MKIRTDYVTNSSSSSFIVKTNKVEDVERVLTLMLEFIVKLNPKLQKLIDEDARYYINQLPRWELEKQSTGVDPRIQRPGFKSDLTYWNEIITQVELPEGSILQNLNLEFWMHMANLESTEERRSS